VFPTTFESLEANLFCWEKVLQFPACRFAVDEPDLVTEEFVAKENVNYCKDVSVSAGANADNKTVKRSNLPSPPQEEEPSKVIQRRPLTFDPLPPAEETKDVQLTATNNQAKLMHWH
jgi:hypothetical protein